SGRGDGETGPARRTPAGPPRPPPWRPASGFRAGRLLATPATAHPPDPPPRAATGAASRPEARLAGGQSSPRSSSRATPRRAVRTRPPAPPASIPLAAPT